MILPAEEDCRNPYQVPIVINGEIENRASHRHGAQARTQIWVQSAPVGAIAERQHCGMNASEARYDPILNRIRIFPKLDIAPRKEFIDGV
jgi:hypothetical protein